LECILYNHYRSYKQGYTYDSTLKAFFCHLPSYLAAAAYDPATGERVDTYLDNNAQITDRTKAINKALKAESQSKEAFEDQVAYPILSIMEWKNLLGEFFPSYG
jgi:hypothetical protein